MSGTPKLNGSKPTSTPSRRSKGEGTIQKRPGKSGVKWRARLPLTELERKTLGLQNAEYWGPAVAKKSLALPNARKQLREELQRLEELSACRLSAVVEGALTFWEKTQKPTTVDLKKRLRDKHLMNSALWNTPASMISSEDMQAFAASLGGSRHSKRNICSLVTAALKLQGFTIKHGQKFSYTPDFPILTKSQQQALVAACVDDDERLLILLPLRCGLRRGEMAGLLREHCRIIQGSPRIYVTEQISTVTGAHIIHDPKTDNSKAWVPVDKETWEIISKRRGYVLTGTDEHLVPGTITDRVKRIGKRIGCGIDGPHDLRHNCGQNWIEAGVPATKVARLLRDRLETVLRIYVRENEEGLDDLAGVILGKISSQKSSRKANDRV